MTTAVVITLLASFLWAVSNHIDKYLLCKINSSTTNIKTLMIFSTFVAGLILSPIWFAVNKFQVQISIGALAITFLATILSLISILFYFKALEKTDASIIGAFFQLIPVFSYIIGLIFFNEQLSINQMIGGGIIILSAVVISFDFTKKSNKSKMIAFIFAVLSSFLYSVYFILLEVAMGQSSYNSVMFWYQACLLLVGLVLLLIKDYRNLFVTMLKVNGKKFISLNIINEGINLIAFVMVNFANLTIPVALVNLLNGFQGAFVFILGTVGMILFPKIFSEDLRKKVVFQKVGCIILGIIGMAIMFL